LLKHCCCAEVAGLVASKNPARVDELLTLIKLPPDEYRDTPRSYPAVSSSGWISAGVGDPNVMLMDEPFAAIDAINRTSLQDEILRLQRQLKKTILFVSHDVEEARLADRMLIMQTGQIVQYDTPFNILTRPANAFGMT